MSKFVTYGATEMLDNDQKFIIDSDRTGPGSITAKDAASSLLSKWAGFETFEEAVQNTISNNQEFIDRDTAIRSETAELKKKIVTTFPAKDASGAVATFESEFEDAPLKSCIVQIEPVQDLHGYDSPWPAGSGKNLLDQSAYTSLENATFSNGKFASNYPYVITDVMVRTFLNGSVVSTTRSSFTVGTRASVTVVVDSTYDSMFIGYRTNGIDNIGAYFAKPNVEDGTYVMSFDVDSTTTGNSSFSNVQFETGSTATSYTPYSNICPITGWTGAKAQRTGKNLLNSDNSAFIVGASYYYSILMDNNKAVMRMTFSDKDTSVDVTKCCIGFADADHNFAGAGSPRNYNWIVNNGNIATNKTNVSIYDESFLCGAVFIYPKTQKTLDRLFSRWNIMVELGSTATDYEPYKGQTYPITFPTEAGTVYGGYIDPINGELVVDRAIVTVDGSTTKFTAKGGTRIFDEYYLPVSDGYLFGGNVRFVSTAEGNNAGMICNIGPYSTSNSVSNNYVAYVGGGGTVLQPRYRFPLNAGIDTLAKANEYAQSTPIQFVYPLATPQTYQLTPQEIASLLGQNNIWANTGDTAVEYLMSDVSWYVEKKLRAFQSVLAGVEDSTSASKNYSANTYLIFNNDIYRVTKAITAGETIEEGVNVTKTTVAEQLMALAQA